jgi:hypothetical protein
VELRYSHFGTTHALDLTGPSLWGLFGAHSRLTRILQVSIVRLLLSAVLLTTAGAATKVHVIAFGKWTSVQWSTGLGTNEKPLIMKIRALVIDGRVKEYALRMPHEVASGCL